MKRSKAQQLTDLTLSVFRLNGALVHWGDAFAAPEGLTSARWQMLGALALAGRPLTTPQVAARMGVTRQGAQKQLNLLAEAGLVEPRDNPRHKRSPLFALTPHGQEVFASVDERWHRHVTQLAAAFSTGDLATTARVLGHLLQLYAGPADGHEA